MHNNWVQNVAKSAHLEYNNLSYYYSIYSQLLINSVDWERRDFNTFECKQNQANSVRAIWGGFRGSVSGFPWEMLWFYGFFSVFWVSATFHCLLGVFLFSAAFQIQFSAYIFKFSGFFSPVFLALFRLSAIICSAPSYRVTFCIPILSLPSEFSRTLKEVIKTVHTRRAFLSVVE